jgi:hypothetical protein
VYRVFNMARVIVDDRDHRDHKPAIAAAFHDIDVFSSLNYLGPSIRTMEAWLQRENVRAVRESIDVGVFFTRTVPRAIVRHLVRHPLDPLPIVRARRALRQAGHGDADR